mgnify:CR=1 FL=1
MISCKKDDETTPKSINEVENLKLLKTFTDSIGNTVELYNNSGLFNVGYNKVYIRIADKDGMYISQSSLEWMPTMTMDMSGMIHQHSCPYSEITKVSGKQYLFEGYIVFIMASNGADNFWELEVEYEVDGQKFEVSEKIDVISTASDYNKIYTNGMGTDSSMYFIALVEPTSPMIGTNDIVVALFKKASMMSFPIVDDYSIMVDPRMPGMGNHSAPGNMDMVQGSDGLYHGKVGFSMTGYWKINLMLKNSTGEVVKGEAITTDVTESSLNLKLEF